MPWDPSHRRTAVIAALGGALALSACQATETSTETDPAAGPTSTVTITAEPVTPTPSEPTPSDVPIEPKWSNTPAPFPAESPQLGDALDRARAQLFGPVVDPDLYAAQAAILRHPRKHVGEHVEMYVFVGLSEGRALYCPHGFLGRVLLGVVGPTPETTHWELDGNNWGLYDKSQEVRFIIDFPKVRGLCDEMDEYVVRVGASVLDEGSPTFFVDSMEFAKNLVDEV